MPANRHSVMLYPQPPLPDSLEVWHNRSLRAPISRLARPTRPYAPSRAPRVGLLTAYGSMADHVYISRRGALLDGTFGLALLSRYNCYQRPLAVPCRPILPSVRPKTKSWRCREHRPE